MAEGIGPGIEETTFRAGDSPEGESITPEITPNAPFVFCLTVKGEGCLTTCPIYKTAVRFTESLPIGAEVNPNLIRARVVFGDAFDRSEDAIGVSKALSSLDRCQRKSEAI